LYVSVHGLYLEPKIILQAAKVILQIVDETLLPRALIHCAQLLARLEGKLLITESIIRDVGMTVAASDSQRFITGRYNIGVSALKLPPIRQWDHFSLRCVRKYCTRANHAMTKVLTVAIECSISRMGIWGVEASSMMGYIQKHLFPDMADANIPVNVYDLALLCHVPDHDHAHWLLCISEQEINRPCYLCNPTGILAEVFEQARRPYRDLADLSED
jgi:hypothetical protein